MAAARRGGRDRSMVVGDCDARGRPLHKRLYVHRAVERSCAVERASQVPRRCAEISGSSGAGVGADVAVAGSGRARPYRHPPGWPPGFNDGWTAMIGGSTLLTSAFVVPLGMLLACLWPRALNRMPSLLAFAPIPALAAVLLVASDSALA